MRFLDEAGQVIRGNAGDSVPRFVDLEAITSIARAYEQGKEVSNKDDHLKNHSFLYVGGGQWRLSPVFDVNPAPDSNPYLEMSILEGRAHDRSAGGLRVLRNRGAGSPRHHSRAGTDGVLFMAQCASRGKRLLPASKII
ncbi:HipA domain-containing protein [Novosphingobium resinovorum]|uniref:HipA domain-containing protein n=2 Tax=Novosphingobium TaxID=165696 RepID=UPI0025A13905|nr:HipA domain-containing protein [Novosphingobium resinovorum]WJM28616.1 HipA domain-containing protein [Novosphingobium resinovorum]